MRKIIVALLLTLAFTNYTLAEGHIPIMNFSGCPGGAWYPDSQVCCMPNQECPLERSANVPSATTKDSILAELLVIFKNIYF